jgi:hypothetical protein
MHHAEISEQFPMSSNPLSDMIGNFIIGLLDGALKKWLAKYEGPGKLSAQDVNDIVTGVHADVKLGLLMKAETPPAPAS